MSMYNLTPGCVKLYIEDEATNFNAAINDTNDFKSFMYKAKLLESTEADEVIKIFK